MDGFDTPPSYQSTKIERLASSSFRFTAKSDITGEVGTSRNGFKAINVATDNSVELRSKRHSSGQQYYELQCLTTGQTIRTRAFRKKGPVILALDGVYFHDSSGFRKMSSQAQVSILSPTRTAGVTSQRIAEFDGDTCIQRHSYRNSRVIYNTGDKFDKIVSVRDIRRIRQQDQECFDFSKFTALYPFCINFSYTDGWIVALTLKSSRVIRNDAEFRQALTFATENSLDVLWNTVLKPKDSTRMLVSHESYLPEMRRFFLDFDSHHEKVEEHLQDLEETFRLLVEQRILSSSGNLHILCKDFLTPQKFFAFQDIFTEMQIWSYERGLTLDRYSAEPLAFYYLPGIRQLVKSLNSSTLI